MLLAYRVQPQHNFGIVHTDIVPDSALSILLTQNVERKREISKYINTAISTFSHSLFIFTFFFLFFPQYFLDALCKQIRPAYYICFNNEISVLPEKQQ